MERDSQGQIDTWSGSEKGTERNRDTGTEEGRGRETESQRHREGVSRAPRERFREPETQRDHRDIERDSESLNYGFTEPKRQTEDS